MARGQDVIGFTRIFVLFCALVLAPALFLSGFGVIAILNEQQADKQRRHEDAARVLRLAEAAFGTILSEADRAVRDGVDVPDRDPADAVSAVRAGGHPIGAWALYSPAAAPLAGDAALVDTSGGSVGARVAQLSLSALPARPAHALVEESGFVAVISMQRLQDGRAIVYAIDDHQLQSQFAARFDGDIRAALTIANTADAPVLNAVDRLLEELKRAQAGDATASDTPEVELLLTRRLDAPFDRFEIVVSGAPSARGTRTAIAYVVLLVVFLATLITGVVITARLIYQETRISRLKTDFVSHVSHELRTPLTSIRLFIDTLRLGRATSKEEQQECLDLLSKETERLSDMIERVLGYARLRAGRRLFQPTDVAVADLVDETLAAFRAQSLIHHNNHNNHNNQDNHDSDTNDAERSGDVVLRTEVSADLPRIHVDREALVEAMLNLVGNAYKYTGPHKEITVFARRGKKARVVIGVQDNGPGLPKAEHARVFERFYQAGGLLSRTKPGSGLGLAITKAIVEGNGGKISVDSEPGRGATFVIEVRAAEGAEASIAPAVNAAPTGGVRTA